MSTICHRREHLEEPRQPRVDGARRENGREREQGTNGRQYHYSCHFNRYRRILTDRQTAAQALKYRRRYDPVSVMHCRMISDYPPSPNQLTWPPCTFLAHGNTAEWNDRRDRRTARRPRCRPPATVGGRD